MYERKEGKKQAKGCDGKNIVNRGRDEVLTCMLCKWD